MMLNPGTDQFDDSIVDWGGPDHPDVYWRVQAFCTFRERMDLPTVHLEFYQWRVQKRTPKGAWVVSDGDRHLVLDASRKKWAYPTKTEAWDSFKIRLRWRANYHRNEGRRIEAIKNLVDKMRPETVS